MENDLELENRIKALIAEGNRKEVLAVMDECGHHLENVQLVLAWGEMLYAEGRMTDALNRFNAVLRLEPGNRKAANYVTMIHNILGYYCKDMFNP